MADPMAIDFESGNKKKKLKRKRGSSSLVNPLLNHTSEEKSAKISSFKEELRGLYEFYRELVSGKGNENVEENFGKSNNCSLDSTIAVLIEENRLPLSKLVDDIFEKVMGKFGGEISSKVTVKSKVLIIGQRIHYGVMNLDADILEDESETTLWCWETKDLKLLPKSMRDVTKIRRTCRKKIQERITAVTAMITALEKLDSHQNCQQELVKASARLSKILGEADIRMIVDIAERTGDEAADKGTKGEDRLLLKQLKKNKRDSEKERKRMEREEQLKKLQNERELKRLQEEAEKEGKRRGKEESEKKRLLNRQQEEAEKEQRRKEKEDAEIKKQLSVKKQASLMERFLKKAKTCSTTKNDQSPTDAKPDSSFKSDKKISESVTLQMDSILSKSDETKPEEIWKLHLNSWHCLGRSIRSNRNMHWGIRRKPKTQLVKELKLTGNRGLAGDDDMSFEKILDDGWVVSGDGRTLCEKTTETSTPNGRNHAQRKQLLQFDKSNRPAFYGVCPKKSEVVNGRHPFAKDLELDYEIDSDEEWEEDEPGESLSDCDKDEEDERMEEGCSKGEDDEESEDGFLVPDGYLSDNEGVEVDKVNSDHLVEESPTSKDVRLNAEDFGLRQRKYLCNLTEHALRKNQPLIISNFMHEKASMLSADNLTGVNKVEQMCLQALSISVFPCGPSVEISISNNREEDEQEACTSNSKASTTTSASTATILESDLPQIASVIQSCSSGINKVVESLQEKFPSVSKTQLRNKVREVSDFIDNRWQVKQGVLVKLGLKISPGKDGGRRRKSIATFFSKRCLPPAGKSSIASPEISPQASQKPIASTAPQQGSTV